MKAIVGFVLVGVGAMNSPRYAPAGLVVKYKNQRITKKLPALQCS